MKRFLALLFVCVSVLSVFSGCRAEGTGKAGVIVSQTDQFTIRRVDGSCYLDLGSQNTRAYWGGGCVVPSGYASFRSADEMYRTLMTGAFDESDIWDIRCTFPLDEDLGFRILDPEKLMVPVLPAGTEIKKVLMGSRELLYSTDSAWFSVITKEAYEDGLDRLSRFVLREENYESLTKYEDGDREVYEYWDWELLHRVTQYRIETSDKTLYVEYEYIEPDNDPEVRKAGEEEYSFYVLGCHNGIYFELENGGLKAPPAEDWLMQFGVTAYKAQ